MTVGRVGDGDWRSTGGWVGGPALHAATEARTRRFTLRPPPEVATPVAPSTIAVAVVVIV